MTQRIFDVENKKDMADLWDILSDEVVKIKKQAYGPSFKYYGNNDDVISITSIININWHDKTEITRPIQEATEADIGKLCKFWSGKDYAIGILKEIDNSSDIDIYGMEDGKNGSWFIHCRRLTKQEIEELI